MTPITRRSLAVLAAGLAFAAGAAQAAWPERPITLIVPWGAGGGTDATARIIGSLLEKELKQPVNVVNRTGGSGVVGHQAIASAAARRLHDRHGHGRDRHDALAGPDRAQGLVLHADRAGQCRPGRPAGARRFALQDRQGADRRHQGQSRQAEVERHRPGRHLASRHRRHAAVARASIPRRRRGCRRTAPRPACRTWWPAASRSCPARCPRRAR